MTQRYLDRWIAGANHYRMQLLGDEADNPDQRIAEDIQLFVERTLSISIGLLSSIVTLLSFVTHPVDAVVVGAVHGCSARTIAIPGYLVWGALLYAVIGTALTHLIGWRLIGLNFTRQKYEADFRFNLVRVRENSEQIALLGGETAERGRLLDRFGRVVENFIDIGGERRSSRFFTASYSQASVIVPYRAREPRLFCRPAAARRADADRLRLRPGAGRTVLLRHGLRSLAEWRAVIERLAGFDVAVAAARAARASRRRW